jgi:hypothetical protein
VSNILSTQVKDSGSGHIQPLTKSCVEKETTDKPQLS